MDNFFFQLLTLFYPFLFFQFNKIAPGINVNNDGRPLITLVVINRAFFFVFDSNFELKHDPDKVVYIYIYVTRLTATVTRQKLHKIHTM